MPRRRGLARNSPLHEKFDVDWFEQNSTRASDVLRTLHASGSPKRNDFVVSLDEYLEEELTEEEWDALFKAKVPQTLLNIASQRPLYRDYFSDPTLPEYVSYLLNCLHAFLKHSISSRSNHRGHGAAANPPWVRYMLQHFPHFWSVIADYPRLIIHDGEEDNSIAERDSDELGYNEALSRLLSAQLLVKHSAIGGFGNVDENATYVALLCFVYCKDRRWQFDPLLFMMSYDFDWMMGSHFNPFLSRALERRLFTPLQIVEQFLNMLLTDHILDQVLDMTVAGFMCFSGHPLVMAARVAQPEVPFALVFAAQRQVCSGEEDQVVHVCRMVFRAIGMYLKDEPGRPGVSRQFLTSRVFSHYMILLLARCLVPVAMNEASDPLDDIRGVARIYGTGAGILEMHEDVEDIDFRGDVRRIWHQKHEELVQLSPSIAPNRQRILDIWTDFGKKCGVDVDSLYNPSTEAEDVPGRRSGRAKRCAWRECLCFGERPQHSLRECKRCKKVRYCSSKCQTRDWNEGGHKHACHREN